MYLSVVGSHNGNSRFMVNVAINTAFIAKFQANQSKTEELPLMQAVNPETAGKPDRTWMSGLRSLRLDQGLGSRPLFPFLPLAIYALSLLTVTWPSRNVS